MAACAALLSVAPAAQASFFAVSEAPAGNSTDPANPGRDLTAFGISYNRTTGALAAAFRVAGAPTPDEAFVGIFAGTRGPNGCNVYPAVGISAFTARGDARWIRLDSPTLFDSGFAPLNGRGEAVQQFSFERSELKGIRPNCAVATLTEPGNASVVYDAIGPIDLVAQPDLTAKFAGVPSPFATGRSRQVSVIVRNVGDAPSGKLRLRLRSAEGVRVKPSVVTVKSIDADGKRTVKVRVTPTSKAAARTDLTAIVGKAPIEARTETEIRHRRKPPSSSGGGGGSGGGSRVCTRWVGDLTGETGGSLTLVPC